MLFGSIISLDVAVHALNRFVSVDVVHSEVPFRGFEPCAVMFVCVGPGETGTEPWSC